MTIRFIVFGSNGLGLYTLAPGDPDDVGRGIFGNPDNIKEIPEEMSEVDAIQTLYLKGGLLKVKPTSSEYYDWDVADEKFIPNIEQVIQIKRQALTDYIAVAFYSPCNGFDADMLSRERISGTIARIQRGDGLPTGWLGWRDASNAMHWASDTAEAVLSELSALSCAIEDREQAVLIAAWTHKATIETLAASVAAGTAPFSTLVEYDITAGWPA